MTAMQAATDSSVEVEVFGQAFTICGTEVPDYLPEVAEYVEAMMHDIAERNPEMVGTRLAVFTALNIAEENHLLKTKLADSNRERRRGHYTKRSHEQRLLAMVNDKSLTAKERHEALHDLGRLRGYLRAPKSKKPSRNRFLR